MKVYVEELKKTKSLYLYGIDGNECTEKLLIALGYAENVFYKLTDEQRSNVNADIEMTDVTYGISDMYYSKVVEAIKEIQEAFDKLSDEADDSDCTAEELADELGLDSKFIL